MPQTGVVYILTFHPDTEYSTIHGIYKSLKGAYERIQRSLFKKELLPGLDELKKDIRKKGFYGSNIIRLDKWYLEE